jgi:capsid assembly protease
MLEIAYLDRDQSNVAGALRSIASTDWEKLRVEAAARKVDMLSAYGLSATTFDKPFAFGQGIAVIPVHGMLVNRFNASVDYATGYDFVRSQFRAALADPDVKNIVLDVNSNGGLVAGCAELAQEIYAGRGVKPSLAMVDSRGYSAAYFVASAASRVVATPTGGVGSIGVLAMHVDMSSALEADGLKVTLLHKGDEKVDGNSLQPLSDRAREKIEQDIGYHYDTFVAAVARNRDLPEGVIRGTQARCYLPHEAQHLGLIDGIKTSTEAMIEYREDVGMDEEQVRAIARQAVEADRARSSGIRNHAEAQGREALAEHLAFETSMSVEAAVSILTAAPKQAATHYPAPTGFAGVMDKDKHPQLGVEAPADEPTDPMSVAERVLGNYAALTGHKFKPLARNQGV